MKTYAGIDLHSSNSYIGIINQKDKRLYSKRHDNILTHILKILKKYKKNLQGVVVESTYNWYWLVDGLMDNGYKVHLANPAAIQQYKGLKFKDDKSDAFWLAHMLRLGILPEGYIYPKEDRPIRDMLRRRAMFVKQRTTQLLSLQSMIARNRGIDFSGSSISKFSKKFLEEVLKCPDKVSIAWRQLETIQFLSGQILGIESEVESKMALKPEYQKLLTIPGIGKILAKTIMAEVGDINRFKKFFTILHITVVSVPDASLMVKGKKTIIEKTEIVIWLGLMLRPPILIKDIVKWHGDLLIKKQLKPIIH